MDAMIIIGLFCLFIGIIWFALGIWFVRTILKERQLMRNQFAEDLRLIKQLRNKMADTIEIQECFF